MWLKYLKVTKKHYLSQRNLYGSSQFNRSGEDVKQMNEYVEELAILLQANIGLTITIDGHASTKADDKYNIELSQQRDDFVRNEIF